MHARPASVTLFACAILLGCADEPLGPVAAPDSATPPQFALTGVRAFLTSTVTQLTTDPHPQLNPSISGDIVVFTDRRPVNDVINDNVYYIDLATGSEVAVTTGPFDKRLHDVSGSRIVYTDYSTLEAAQVWMYDVETGESTQLSPTDTQQLEPTIDGDIIVYEDYPDGVGTNADVAILDLTTNTVTKLAATPLLHDGRPTVGGNLVVYERGSRPLDKNAEIVVYDLITGTETVVGNGLEPHTDGRRVAWATGVIFDPDGSDVFVYDVATGITTSFAGPREQTRPRLAGDLFAYDEQSLGSFDVVVVHLPTGATLRLPGGAEHWEFLNDIDGNRVAYTSLSLGPSNYDIFLAELTIHVGDIDVAPSSVNFGDVPVGSASTQIVTIANTGAADLEVGAVGLTAGTDAVFEISSISATLPAALGPGDVVDVQVTFAPSTQGAFTGILRILSDDYDEPVVDVPLDGSGADGQSVDQKVSELLAFFDAAAADGTLAGNGSGQSAEKRREALRNMLVAAGGMIAEGRLEDACAQLRDAYNRTDGQPQPPDFVTGAAAVELRDRIAALIKSLGCATP